MNLLFRTDASVQIGTGHVMRCLALAQAWQDAGGRAVFAMAETTPAVLARLAAESCEVLSVSSGVATEEDARQTIAFAREKSADWIVVDGYRFTADYQHALKAAGRKVLFIDDYGQAGHYFADLVLNQNVIADERLYANREPYSRLLLGPRYCLLRREFSAWRSWKREVPLVCSRVLVTMGGSDPGNLTARVIQTLRLANLEQIDVTIVVGGSNPHFDMLPACAAESGLRTTVLQDAANVAELMAAADVAVSAAGSTCWELCLMGLPALLIDAADNQTALAEELDRRGCAVHAGSNHVSPERIATELKRMLDSQELRQSLAQRSRELVDGDGARRVVSVLRGTPRLRLRPATPEDRRLLWEWANDPEVRAASFSPSQISWDTHVAWFAKMLDSAGTQGAERSLILIAEDEAATPLGHIRFEAMPDGDWDVGVSVASEARGRGLGRAVIQLGVENLLCKHPRSRVHAFIKPSNRASIKAFEDAHFKRIGNEQIRGNAAVHLIHDEGRHS
jgi:UDP-2,4-diacetamido-2,4,6-trideoxy-beta-L-altropyranose hydrolase